MKAAVLAVVVAGLVWLGRKRVVDVLTTTTGTWVGSPGPVRPPDG